MSAGNDLALEGLIKPELEKQLSATEIWKANLLAIYTKHHKFGKDEPKHSWQYIADISRRLTSKDHDLARTPGKAWVCELEEGLPKLDEALDKVLKNTWAAKVLQYLHEISHAAARQDLLDMSGGNPSRHQDLSGQLEGDKLRRAMVR